MRSKRWKNWIFCLVVAVLCGALTFLPDPQSQAGKIPRERVRVLSVDNSHLAPLGIVYSGVQMATVRIETGPMRGQEVEAANYQNAALDKDKLFAEGDTALAMVSVVVDGRLSVTLIDHYRLFTEGVLFGLFAVLLILFGGFSGCGALVSLVASVMVIWKVLIPLMLLGISPLFVSLAVVLLLTTIIVFLVAGFQRMAYAALLARCWGR